MLKLYRLSGPKKEYWETWEQSPGRHLVHWGELGTRGSTRTVEAGITVNAMTIIQKEIHELVVQGYAPVEDEDHSILMVEYQIDGMGTSEDLKKRHALEARLNETLGWTGLGSCDGGSIGSGTMEVCTFVVDFEIAKKVVEADLADTEFANFSRIYNEREAS